MTEPHQHVVFIVAVAVAAVAGWLDWRKGEIPNWIEAQMYGFFAGAILAPARLAYEGKLFTTMKNALLIGANLFLPATKQRTIDSAVLSWFRLGPAIAIGVALACYLHW